MRGAPDDASHRLAWMWHDEPTSAIDHLAMNVAARPHWSAISFTPFLNTRCRSATSTALAVGDVDLVLAPARLTLGELDRDPRLGISLRIRRSTYSSRDVCSSW